MLVVLSEHEKNEEHKMNCDDGDNDYSLHS
jgi:hypothetical protein